MARNRSSSQIEKAPATVPKDDQPPTSAPKDKEKPSLSHPEEDKIEEDDQDSTSSASSSSGEDDDEEDDDPPSSQPASKNTTPPAKSNPESESDEDDEDEEESDSDSDKEPITKLKSLNSKSNDQISKPKSVSKTSPAPARSGTKRPVDNDPKQAKKRKTTVSAENHGKEPEEENNKSGEDSKKFFQRLFTDEDEVAILKGMYDFITKTGSDPFKYHTAYYEFVKKSIHTKVTLEQLRDKMRRLRLKYERKAMSGKTHFTRDIDQTMFELGQKIWGVKLNVNEADEKGKLNGKLSKREPAAKKPTTKKLVLEPDSQLVGLKETKKDEITVKVNPGSSLALSELIRFEAMASVSRPKKVDLLKKGMELLEESKREELEKRWEKLEIAELEVFKMQADLAADHAEFILDALKSSSN